MSNLKCLKEFIIVRCAQLPSSLATANMLLAGRLAAAVKLFLTPGRKNDPHCRVQKQRYYSSETKLMFFGLHVDEDERLDEDNKTENVLVSSSMKLWVFISSKINFVI